MDTVPPTSLVVGKAHAKSGALVSADLLRQSLMLTLPGNAGYLTSRSGREIVFGTFVMYVSMKTIDEVFTIHADVGSGAEAIYVVT